jgi:hypothetical protein
MPNQECRKLWKILLSRNSNNNKETGPAGMNASPLNQQQQTVQQQQQQLRQQQLKAMQLQQQHQQHHGFGVNGHINQFMSFNNQGQFISKEQPTMQQKPIKNTPTPPIMSPSQVA